MVTPYAQIAKRLPSPIFKLGAQAFIKKDYPRHLFIETTANCNLSCSYCPRERESSDMDFGLFRKIVDEASGYGSRSFSLHLLANRSFIKGSLKLCGTSRNGIHVTLSCSPPTAPFSMTVSKTLYPVGFRRPIGLGEEKQNLQSPPY